MKKPFKPIALLKRMQLYIAANCETHQENKAKMYFAMYGTGIYKKTKRSWYNPLRWILGKNGVKIVDPRKFFEENPDCLSPKDIKITSVE